MYGHVFKEYLRVLKLHKNTWEYIVWWSPAGSLSDKWQNILASDKFWAIIKRNDTDKYWNPFQLELYWKQKWLFKRIDCITIISSGFSCVSYNIFWYVCMYCHNLKWVLLSQQNFTSLLNLKISILLLSKEWKWCIKYITYM